MSTLKPLTLKGLNASQTKNFKLDFDIVSTNLTNAELCKNHGINQSRISNRKASLVSRGHLKPSAKAIAKAITQPTNTQEVKTKELVEVLGNVIASFSKEVDKPKVGDFTNNKGVNKEIARNKMAKYIVDSNVEGLVPTLPYIHANIEKKILAQNENYEFIGVEKLPIVYDAMVQTIKNEKLPIKPYLGDFCDKIYGAKENQYAHIIGDYCGELPTFASEVEYAVSNKIVKVGGIMALTFGKPIRSKCLKSDSIFKLGSFITNHDTDVRSQSDKAIEGYFQRLIGFDFELTEIFNYHDDKGKGKGYPMVLVILKRLR